MNKYNQTETVIDSANKQVVARGKGMGKEQDRGMGLRGTN